jgi:hypothetical protein
MELSHLICDPNVANWTLIVVYWEACAAWGRPGELNENQQQ